jgi:FecR-like protein
MPRLSNVGSILMGAVAVLCSSAAVAEPEIGVVVQQQYSGALGTRVSSQAEELDYFKKIFAEERVDTNETAVTSLQFLDNTNLYVGIRSSVMLDRFIYDPNTHKGEATVNFTKGVFRFVTGNIKTKEAVTLNTPTASMVIRGTHLLIYVLADGTSEVNVLEGAIDLTPCESTEAQRINAGQRITITASCGTDRTTARNDDQSRGLIPQMPTELAAVEDVVPAAGDEDPGYVIPDTNEETGKGGERDRGSRQGGRDGKY